MDIQYFLDIYIYFATHRYFIINKPENYDKFRKSLQKPISGYAMKKESHPLRGKRLHQSERKRPNVIRNVFNLTSYVSYISL